MVFKSMSSMRYDMPDMIFDRHRQLNISDDSINHAAGLIHWLDDVYGIMDLRISGYHNHVHNLAVSYAGLLLLNNPEKKYSARDVKIVFLGGLTSDVHLRNPHRKETESRTSASVAETLRQLRQMVDLEGADPKETRFSDIVTPDKKDFFQKAFRGYLDGEDFLPVFYELESLILRTDFPSDVPFFPELYKKLSNQIRELTSLWVGGKQDWETTRNQVSEIESSLQKDLEAGKLKKEQIPSCQRYLAIEKNYLMSLKKIEEKRRFHIYYLARLLEIADQSAFYCLGTPVMVLNEVVPELQKEIHAVSVEGTYPSYFVPQLLSSEVLYFLRSLPEKNKRNFVDVLRQCAEISQHIDDWKKREKSVLDSLKIK